MRNALAYILIILFSFAFTNGHALALFSNSEIEVMEHLPVEENKETIEEVEERVKKKKVQYRAPLNISPVQTLYFLMTDELVLYQKSAYHKLFVWHESLIR